jgi:hypothetical protein
VRIRSELFRLTCSVALGALLSASGASGVAWAQAASPPPPVNTSQPDQSQGDPPVRVGRLALITGGVSFHNPGDTDWSDAVGNYPVVAGNSFWTQPGAEADLEFGDSRIAMNESTEFDLSTLDDSNLDGTLPQGEVFVHVRTLAPGETIAIATPRGTVTISAPGDYGLSTGDTEAPTMVTVLAGAAQIDGTTLTLHVAAGQTATITGIDNFQGGVGPAVPDAFLTRMLARNRPPPAPRVAPPPVVAAMPGGEDLAAVGTWRTVPQYGQVWFPPEPASWVPYRDGHWAYVAPWGWTWIDNARWGFAPFHYGRWTNIDGRWGWIPAPAPVPGVRVSVTVARPLYAPALVVFFGLGANVGVNIGIGGNVGWCPLGPGEPFHPWYRASPTYVREVNVRNTTVTNITNITRVNNITINQYHNARFATVVPAATLVDSRPVRRTVVQVPPRRLAELHPVVGQEPVRPAATTLGMTPAVARQRHIEAGPNTPGRRPAPGPAPHPVERVVAGHPAQVPLRRPGQPQKANQPAEVLRPGSPPGTAAQQHPGTNRPATPESPAATKPEQNRPASGVARHPGQPAAQHPGAAATPPAAPRPDAANGPTVPGAPKAGPKEQQAHPAGAIHPAESNHPGTPGQATTKPRFTHPEPKRPPEPGGTNAAHPQAEPARPATGMTAPRQAPRTPEPASHPAGPATPREPSRATTTHPAEPAPHPQAGTPPAQHPSAKAGPTPASGPHPEPAQQEPRKQPNPS